MPNIIYGTAWKKEQTTSLVVKAIKHGFRAIDTACQPKHYDEPGVGQALKELKAAGISREEIYLQTKFTPLSGQDPNNVPYDPNAPLEEQVRQSMAVSLENLGTDYVDCLVLHSPLNMHKYTMQVYKAMEEIYQEGKAKQLGISNCYYLQTLKQLYHEATIKPLVVQNRFYRESGYDQDLRRWCVDHGIMYQSFWTLTANPILLQSIAIRKIADSHNKTPEQVLFRYLSQVGVVPLTGTKSDEHMIQDLSIFSFELSEAEIKYIHQLLVEITTINT